MILSTARQMLIIERKDIFMRGRGQFLFYTPFAGCLKLSQGCCADSSNTVNQQGVRIPFQGKAILTGIDSSKYRRGLNRTII
jgi:hypothetical protein